MMNERSLNYRTNRLDLPNKTTRQQVSGQPGLSEAARQLRRDKVY